MAPRRRFSIPLLAHGALVVVGNVRRRRLSVMAQMLYYNEHVTVVLCVRRTTAMPVPVPSRARVFISYKRHVQPDEFLALALYQGLSHLSGVVRREQGVLRVRDRIYHAVLLLLGLPVASQRQRIQK